MTLRQATKTNAEPYIPKLILETEGTEDWSRVEKLQMYQDMCSATRDDLAFPEELMEKIRSSSVKSVLQFDPGERAVGWFCVVEWIRKTTKNKKVFYRVKITDDESNTGWLRVWGELPKEMQPYTIWLTESTNDKNWGASTSSRRLRPLVI